MGPQDPPDLLAICSQQPPSHRLKSPITNPPQRKPPFGLFSIPRNTFLSPKRSIPVMSSEGASSDGVRARPPDASTAPRAPESITAASDSIRDLINDRVRRPIVSSERGAIDPPDSVVAEARKIGGLASAFLCLVAMQSYQTAGEGDDLKKELHFSRAAYAEALAGKVVESYEDREELFVWVLAGRWPDPIDHLVGPNNTYVPARRRSQDTRARRIHQRSLTERFGTTGLVRRCLDLFRLGNGNRLYLPIHSPGNEDASLLPVTDARDVLPTSSALEKAIDVGAARFIANVAVRDCIKAIWDGKLVNRPGEMLPEFRTESEDEVGFRGVFRGRIRVPKYQLVA